MRKPILLMLLAAGLPLSGMAADDDPARRAMDAFVGDWTLVLAADRSTFGDRAGAGRGTMQCRYGPIDAWVDCIMDSHYDGMGRYTMQIVIHSDGPGFGAFVTNSFGGGRSYVGHWLEPRRLVFVDRIVDPSRKWPYQRTTYTFDGPDALEFAVEVSADGIGYLPHSRGTYHRR